MYILYDLVISHFIKARDVMRNSSNPSQAVAIFLSGKRSHNKKTDGTEKKLNATRFLNAYQKNCTLNCTHSIHF